MKITKVCDVIKIALAVNMHGAYNSRSMCLIKCLKLEKVCNAWQMMREFPFKKNTLNDFIREILINQRFATWVTWNKCSRPAENRSTILQELMNKAIDQWLDRISLVFALCRRTYWTSFAIRQHCLICVFNLSHKVVSANVRITLFNVSVCFRFLLNYFSNICKNFYWPSFWN